jgi:hypothetical protein
VKDPDRRTHTTGAGARPRVAPARAAGARVVVAALATFLVIAATGARTAAAAVSLDDGSAEAQLMGYYSAALAFTPTGAPGGDPVEAGMDFTYIPALSEENRQVTFAGSKVENTNLISVMPRPRLRWRPHPDWLIEAGFFPDATVQGVSPQQVEAAATWRFAGGTGGAPSWRVRGHYLIADITGPFTCSKDAVDDPTNTVCFGGQTSSDEFKPEVMGVDLLVDGPHLFTDGLAWYAGAGYRHETLHFETHFVNVAGRLDDQKLVARLDRGSIFGGLTWSAWRRLKISGEGYWAPDAMATVRACISWGWGGTR